MNEKFCPHPTCQKVKPVAEFAKNARRKDGLQCYCNACRSEIARIYAQSEKGKQARKSAYCRNMQKSEFREQRASQSKRQLQQLKKNGLCLTCGKPSRPNLTICGDCNVKKTASEVKRRNDRSEKGLCNKCKSANILPATLNKKYVFCENCYIKSLSNVGLKTPKHWQILKAKLVTQNYRCVYTGKILVLGKNASIDHILPIAKFPHLISEPTNIQWVDLTVNQMKGSLTHTEFLELVKLIQTNLNINS